MLSFGSCLRSSKTFGSSSLFGKGRVLQENNQQKFSTSRYDEVYAQWKRDPQGFWAEAAEKVKWFKRWDTVFDQKTVIHDGWFKGGKINACFNALDVHVLAGKGDQVALIWDSPVTKSKSKFTYSQLRDDVMKFAGVLQKFGVEKGDRVVIYNPAIPHTIVAMLACARLGAIHSVVFGGFSSDELATRIDDAKPKVIVSASCGIEHNKPVEYKPLLDRAIEICAHKPEKVVIYQRPGLPKAPLIAKRDFDWEEMMSQARSFQDVVEVPTDHPLYILYTSGTTGKPKGVVRDTGGSVVALKWSMKNIYGMDEGDTWWAASDLGWVVGHSYILYGPMFNRNTSILYEGKPVGTPDAGAFWRMIEEYKVKSLFAAPTGFRAIKKEDPNADLMKKYNLSSLKTLFLAGERADPPTVNWLRDILKRPVIDHWWMTETGWPMTANFDGLGLFPIKVGSGGKAVPGYQLEVLDDEGKPLPKGKEGNLVVKLPMPPGTMVTLYGNLERFKAGYLKNFPGYLQTGDAGHIDEENYVHIMSRTDDIINVAGHRLSTGAIEEVIGTVKAVAENAVFGFNDEIKGHVPVACVILKNTPNQTDIEAVKKEIVHEVRKHLGPVYSFKKVIIVKRLPKTRSGKILRSTMAKIANGEEYKVPATIDDPAIISEIKETFQKELTH